jgi:glycosyltransferase involved in cell wall biosynthesis
MVRRILFDVTRLLQRANRASPTGIDRVVMAYARWLGSRPDLEAVPVAAVAGRLALVDQDIFRRQLANAEAPAPRPATEQWRRLLTNLDPAGGPFVGLRPTGRQKADPGMDWGLLGRFYLRGRLTPAPQGEVYLNVSHSGLEQADLLPGLAARGVAPVVMLHDLIPITHPEFCGPGAHERHERRVQSALRNAALILTNSQATSEDLARYAEGLGGRGAVIQTAPLGVEGAFLSPPAVGKALRPYFVCVGTIEARKNLAFLLTLWRRLVERMGEGAPHLVLVGRRGWENEAVIDHLERSPAVRSRVHEITDLTDAQVAGLIAGARALLGPSLAEGFDLPVMEALTLGAPVIASDIPVHRELARGATLIDPLDGLGWLSAIENACRARPVGQPRAIQTWEQHFAIVGEALALAGNAGMRPHTADRGHG